MRCSRLCSLVLLASWAGALFAQSAGTIQGTVTLQSSNTPLHHATVLIVQLGRTTETDNNGRYEFRQVPAGRYDVIGRLQTLTSETRRVDVSAGGAATADFALALQPLRTEVTVTATGSETTTLQAFPSAISVSGDELLKRVQSASLGDLLEQEPGIAKRSFGPGTTRPVIRGFDGDRVLVLQDGTRTGTLSSQSGDHGEPVDPLALERVEVLRGPAVLLYGSNAIGGVVNVVTDQGRLRQADQDGLHGSFTAQGGTANGMGGGSGNLHYTRGGWSLRGGGGGLRTGDYDTPLGTIENSFSNLWNTRIGGSRVTDRGFLSLDYAVQDGTYGVPFAAEFEGGGEEGEGEEHGHEGISIDWRRHNTRLAGGLRNLNSYLNELNAYVNYSDWRHNELEGDEIGTRFRNKQATWQGTLRQARRGLLSGSFGAWGLHRRFRTTGAEALAPPVDQNAVALFAVEELGFERFRLQFGGRYERNAYDAEGLRSRTFNAFSGSAGVSVPLADRTVLVGSYTHSSRAPALEELYNNGPHIGNLTFEVGNPNLRTERGNGVEASLRSQNSRLRAEVNGYYYRLRNFVFLAPTGEIEDGLVQADYAQAGARYLGAEARLDASLTPNVWLNLGFDVVDAQIRETRTPLPRIPPVRGRVGLDFRYGGFHVRPELVLSNRQWQVFPTETATAGFAVVNLIGGYTLARAHALHTFSANLFNAGDRLYRNHLSFIKERAPEIGRGVRFSYTVSFF